MDAVTVINLAGLARHYLLLQATVMMSLLQPAPEVFELFDDVLLLSEGQVVYHGPREQVMPFFHSLGFAIPARKGIADFLQEVTSRKVRDPRVVGDAYVWCLEFGSALTTFVRVYVPHICRVDVALHFWHAPRHGPC